MQSKVTVVRYHAGNLAIEDDVFTVPIAVAKKLRTLIRTKPLATQQYFDLNRKIMRSYRAGGIPYIKVHTSGFSTGHFSNLIAEADPAAYNAMEFSIDARTDSRGKVLGRAS